MDIDLEGRVNNQLDHIKEVVATVCGVDVESDGITFNRTSIEVSRIKEDADHEGVRVQCWGMDKLARTSEVTLDFKAMRLGVK